VSQIDVNVDTVMDTLILECEGPLEQIKQLYNSTHTKTIFDRGFQISFPLGVIK
jgi:hypothetical protein